MQRRLTSIIIDDEPDARNELKRIIRQELSDVEVVSMESDAQAGLEAIIDHKPDIVFLDIHMPGKDGFWLTNKLRNADIHTEIIFVTAFDEYAIEAIRHSAFDFITKPTDPSLLKKAIDRFHEKKNNGNNHNRLDLLSQFLSREKFKFNNQTGFIMISPEDIVFCEAEGNYSVMQLSNGKSEMVTQQLGIIENKITDYSFIRINRSTIINLDYLDSYNRNNKRVSLVTHLQKFELVVSNSGAKRLKSI